MRCCDDSCACVKVAEGDLDTAVPGSATDRPAYVAVPPGGVLVIRVSEAWTPSQMRDYQQQISELATDQGWPFKCAVVCGEELAVAKGGKPAEPGPAGFLADCEITHDPAVPGVRVRHIPSGISRSGPTVDSAGTALAAELLARGKITVNDARAAHGLRPFDLAAGAGVAADA